MTVLLIHSPARTCSLVRLHAAANVNGPLYVLDTLSNILNVFSDQIDIINSIKDNTIVNNIYSFIYSESRIIF